jgi:RNA 2',3'-cyclic 3'-phosphodiesterase
VETIRAFIAIELSGEVKKALTQLQSRLKSGSRTPVKWTDPEGTHLTLQFLGNIDAGKVSRITAAMEAAVSDIRPFRLIISGMGVFPSPARVRVVWVGLKGDVEILASLQKRVEEELKPLGFAPETRAFTPHLTLGRVRDEARPEERQGLGRLIGGTEDNIETAFDVNSVHLFRSQLRPTGAVYTRIATVELIA